MTPIDLLDDVKSRFSILLYDDEAALFSLLRKAFLTYQDRAGFVCRRRYSSGDDLTLPADYLARICVTDSNQQFIPSTVWPDSDELELTLYGGESFPVTLMYLSDVNKQDFQSWQIPSSAYSLIADYLEVLIAIPNNERLSRMAAIGKMDVSTIPVFGDLSTKQAEIEQLISDSRAIIPVFGVMG